MISWLLNKLWRQAPLPPKGIFLGAATHGGKPLVLDDSELRSHVAMFGRGAAGRSTLLQQALTQQTVEGKGWIYIDTRCDAPLRNHLAETARGAGRLDDFYVLDLGSPGNSNTYDVLRGGTPEARAARVLTLFPDVDAAQISDCLTAVFGALDAAGQSVGPRELAELLMDLAKPTGNERLFEDVPGGHPAGPALTAALEALARDAAARQQLADMGAAGPLHLLSTLKSATVFCHPEPEIDFETILAQGRMCFVLLPTLAEPPPLVAQLAQMLVQDICTSLHARGKLPGSLRHPFLVAMDGFPEYGLQKVSDEGAAIIDATYAQARGLGVSLMPIIDSSSWDDVRARYRTDTLTANTRTKVYFRQDDSEHLSAMHPGLPSKALSTLALGEFVMCKGTDVVAARLRYTDTGTPPGFRRQPMPVVDARPRWQAPPLRKTP